MMTNLEVRYAIMIPPLYINKVYLLYIIRCMLDFLLLYIIRYKGRSNNSHKIFPEFFLIELFAINKGVCLPGQG